MSRRAPQAVVVPASAGGVGPANPWVERPTFGEPDGSPSYRSQAREERVAAWPMPEKEESNLYFVVALAADPVHTETFEAISSPVATAFVGEALVIRLGDGQEEPASVELMATTHDCPHCKQAMPERTKKSGEVTGSTFTPDNPGLYRLRVTDEAGRWATLFVGAVPRETTHHIFVRVHQAGHLRGEERSPRERVSMVRSFVRDIAHSGVLDTLTPSRPIPPALALNAYG